MMKKAWLIIIVSVVFCITTNAQQLEIGQWQSMFSYNSANGVALNNNLVYSGRYGLLEYDVTTNQYTQYSKVNGITDIGIQKLAVETQKNALIITYESSNIDILQNGIFYNVPDLKKANIAENKRINNVNCFNGDAYLSTGLGIVVVNIDKHEIKTTYPMLVGGAQAEVYDVTLHNNKIYAATNKGFFCANSNNNFLQNIDNWVLISNAVIKNMVSGIDSFYVCTDTEVFSLDANNNTHFIYKSLNTILDIAEKNNTTLVLSCIGEIVDVDKNGTTLEKYFGNQAQQIAVNNNGIWVANVYGGLKRIQTAQKTEELKINGPFSASAFNMRWINNKLYVASGGVQPTYNFLENKGGINIWNNQNWTSYNQYINYPQMDSAQDILDVAVDPVTQSIYCTSFGGGLLEIKKDGQYVQLARNSIILSSQNGNYAWLATNLKYDDNNNLWITVSNADKNLIVKKPDGNYVSLTININGEFKVLSDFVIDNIGQKWIIIPRLRGAVVFNDNGSLENTADDQQKLYNINAGNGNLASNNVLCIAKDLDGKIWMGTDNGISIVNCPESAFVAGGCDAENKIVQYDAFANRLFKDEYVNAIAVDGANRKWVGTFNGVWLISSDAEKILARFNKDNSPLPTNEINKIEIDPATGVVYFATSQGIVSYKSTATEGRLEADKLLAYPNPVESNYEGTIAIKGFVTNADVRIVDEAGQLVYRTTALGGQAIWNGKTYTGERPHSGVYYVLGTNADGSQTQQTKIILLH
jgi:Two component regulator propeller